MSLALDARGLAKRYTVGIASCVASAEVLRGVELTIEVGEIVAVVGAAGAGKSTLALCAAGLLRPERGEIRWFGSADRATAIERASYCTSVADLGRMTAARSEPILHVTDLRDHRELGAPVQRWIAERAAAGDAVLLTMRDVELAARHAARVLVLSHGVLRASARPHARVAEERTRVRA